MGEKYITESIAEIIEGTEYQLLNKQEIEKTKYCILDSIGCTLGGAKTEIGSILIKTLANNESSLKNTYTIIGSRERADKLNAIYINANNANILDYDDVYLGHPNSTIVPVAFNLAEEIKVTGKELINAICLAYNLMLKIGLGLRQKEERKYRLGHSTWQTFGSMIVASKFLDLDRKEIANALGITGCNAPIPSVMKSVYGDTGPTMVKNTYGIASVSGVIAAKLAKNGFTGPRDFFEGETGFWRMIGSNTNLVKGKIEKQNDENLILRIGFKPYPCCRLTHSSIEAADNIMKETNLSYLDIKEINIKTVRALTKSPFSNATPTDFYSGKFSLPYVVACNLKGIEKVRWHDKENIESQEVTELAKKVTIQWDNDADLQFQLDPGKITSTVEILYKNGQKKFTKIEIPLGDPRNPMTPIQLKEKFLSLADRTKTSESRKLFDLIMDIENIKDMNNLISYLRY